MTLTKTSSRAVVVTGAASGIGRATVELFADRGYRVLAVDLVAEDLASVSRIDGVATFAGDVSCAETNESMIELAVEQFQRLDAVVLNAGIGGTLPLESVGAIERFDRIMAVNVRGVALGIRAALPGLRANGGGAIVVTASADGLRASPSTWAYSASKAAVINLVRAAALDYAVEGIRINAVAPGLTATAMTSAVRDNAELSTTLVRRIPMQRWGEAREQAEVIWFLASPAASYVTGATVSVDGGGTASNGILLPPAHAGAGPQ